MNSSSNTTLQSPLGIGPTNRTAGHDTTPARRSDAAPDVHNLLGDIQGLVGQLGHVADPEVTRVRARLSEALTAAARAVADGSEQARRQVLYGVRGGDAYVRSQPWQAVGIAAAAGLLVGILVAKR